MLHFVSPLSLILLNYLNQCCKLLSPLDDEAAAGWHCPPVAEEDITSGPHEY